MTDLAHIVHEPDQIGFLVTGEWCDRCGDQNYDDQTHVCLTCTDPSDPCSVAYLEGHRDCDDACVARRMLDTATSTEA